MRTLNPIEMRPSSQPLARGLASLGVFAARCLFFAAVLALLPGIAAGDVIVNGSVSPGDNPFTTGVNEGLPFFGNGVNFNDPPTADDQPLFEGLEDIIIGVTAPGDVTINNGSFLRYQDLTIGSSSLVGEGLDEHLEFGTGLLRIVGVGAYYNNNPTLLPAGFPTFEEFGSRREADVGYDLIVGETSLGLMEVIEGARAEIQDAVMIGDAPGSDGYLTIDGVGSHLVSGGFSTDIGFDEQHQLMVGRHGFGSMTISNGGRVSTNVGGDMALPLDFVAAVVGGDAFIGDDEPMTGGEGSVLVTGPTSRWTIRASLQLGGFHHEEGLFGPESESEGDNLVYSQFNGKGTLTVADGALVTILPLDSEEQSTQALMLAIGRRGKLELAGGRLNVGANIGADPEFGERDDQMRIVNDGIITGDGYIDTGIFRNRYLGVMEVFSGQRMVINASAGFADPDEDAPPMVNWGVIRVLGNEDFRAELEFDRIPTSGGLPAPFQNRQLTTVPLVGRAAGLIHVQDGMLRFRTGLENQGSLAFTGGENLIIGDVLNLAGDGVLLADGVISIDGVETHVVFEGDVTNDGVMDIGASSEAVDVLGDFSTTGSLQLELTPLSPFRINVLGDADVDGRLQVSLLGLSPSAGDAFGVLSATGDLTGIFTEQQLPSLATDLGWTVDYDYDIDTITLRVLSLTTVVGADFNGDGVVNLEDLAIWELNFGITEGASPLQGDADGDGDVDGDDFDAWVMQMTPGAGGGAGSEGLGNVPEPTGLALALVASVLALAPRRRSQ
jgi:T5SS/PEP-CTERM-associated repeat protein